MKNYLKMFVLLILVFILLDNRAYFTNCSLFTLFIAADCIYGSQNILAYTSLNNVCSL